MPRPQRPSDVLTAQLVHLDRAEPVELGGHDASRAAAAPRPSARRTARSPRPRGARPGPPARRPARRRAAAGWPITAPPAAVSIRAAAPEHAAEHAQVDQVAGRRARAPSTTRAAPALSATESTSRNALGVARVDDLDRRPAPPRWPRAPRRPSSAPAIAPADRNAISGSARGWMSSSSGSGSPDGTQHARGQPAVHRFVDAQRVALDPAGQAQLRADDALAGLQPVLDEQRLRLVARSRCRGTGCVRVNGGDRRCARARPRSARRRSVRGSVMRRPAALNRAVTVAEVGELGLEDVARPRGHHPVQRPPAARCRRGAARVPSSPSVLASQATQRAGLPSAAAPAPLSIGTPLRESSTPTSRRSSAVTGVSAATEDDARRTRRCPRRCRRCGSASRRSGCRRPRSPGSDPADRGERVGRR